MKRIRLAAGVLRGPGRESYPSLMVLVIRLGYCNTQKGADNKAHEAGCNSRRQA